MTSKRRENINLVSFICLSFLIYIFFLEKGDKVMGGGGRFLWCLLSFLLEPHSRVSFAVCHQSIASYICE